ncbi:hypothetical protein PCH_Pc23g00650 [Penicillium rubens Wisconsin 54-1255]|uniref:Uncharacterized protein n=1 Tax=Penicillium rubens (strain ATCC 28089 / DSM 1075 / NRRL 1951 / Wisconsin 54-1255) TaxID=500485 RepID=B6HWB5_PENRW|nr:hypothetical protein PCH_Pc23g00650 [Penicillium rubens Wisconsin 54-1255]
MAGRSMEAWSDKLGPGSKKMPIIQPYYGTHMLNSRGDKYQFRPCLKEGSGISRTLVYVDAYIWRRTGVADQTHLRGRGYRWFGSIGGSTPFASRFYHRPPANFRAPPGTISSGVCRKRSCNSRRMDTLDID